MGRGRVWVLVTVRLSQSFSGPSPGTRPRRETPPAARVTPTPGVAEKRPLAELCPQFLTYPTREGQKAAVALCSQVWVVSDTTGSRASSEGPRSEHATKQA